MNNITEQTIGQIVAADYRAAKVFRDYGIDFCCGGTKTIDDVCANTKIETDEVIAALENMSEEGREENRYNNWSLDFLADYIIMNHHAFMREKIPEISFYSKKVANVHGGDHEELIDIAKEFEKLANDMTHHMNEEEKQVFPFIKQLVDEKEDEPDQSTEIINLMKEEHDDTGNSLKKIRKLSSNFAIPDDACNTYRVYFKNLKNFEQDMFKHIHLENNILFPKALQQCSQA